MPGDIKTGKNQTAPPEENFLAKSGGAVFYILTVFFSIIFLIWV